MKIQKYKIRPEGPPTEDQEAVGCPVFDPSDDSGDTVGFSSDYDGEWVTIPLWEPTEVKEIKPKGEIIILSNELTPEELVKDVIDSCTIDSFLNQLFTKQGD